MQPYYAARQQAFHLGHVSYPSYREFLRYSNSGTEALWDRSVYVEAIWRLKLMRSALAKVIRVLKPREYHFVIRWKSKAQVPLLTKKIASRKLGGSCISHVHGACCLEDRGGKRLGPSPSGSDTGCHQARRALLRTGVRCQKTRGRGDALTVFGTARDARRERGPSLRYLRTQGGGGVQPWLSFLPLQPTIIRQCLFLYSILVFAWTILVFPRTDNEYAERFRWHPRLLACERQAHPVCSLCAPGCSK